MDTLVVFLQQYAGLFTALGGIATVLGHAFVLYRASHNNVVRGLQRRIKALKDDHATDVVDHDKQMRTLKDDHEKQVRVWKTAIANAKNLADQGKQVPDMKGLIKILKDDLARQVADHAKQVQALNDELGKARIGNEELH
jgi:hypothetical protein